VAQGATGCVWRWVQLLRVRQGCGAVGMGFLNGLISVKAIISEGFVLYILVVMIVNMVARPGGCQWNHAYSDKLHESNKVD